MKRAELKKLRYPLPLEEIIKVIVFILIVVIMICIKK